MPENSNFPAPWSDSPLSGMPFFPRYEMAITNAKDSDSGAYTCTNKKGGSHTVNLIVKLQILAEMIWLVHIERNVTPEPDLLISAQISRFRLGLVDLRIYIAIRGFGVDLYRVLCPTLPTGNKLGAVGKMHTTMNSELHLQCTELNKKLVWPTSESDDKSDITSNITFISILSVRSFATAIDDILLVFHHLVSPAKREIVGHCWQGALSDVTGGIPHVMLSSHLAEIQTENFECRKNHCSVQGVKKANSAAVSFGSTWPSFSLFLLHVET
uniref:Uncharacterized protein n=1 Tax=Strigamia maritima TaxID=126957 RepID=T1JP87_STRMM